MIKAFKYRIYPNVEQKVLLAKHFGSCRWVYNWCLDKKNAAYQQNKEILSKYGLSAMLPNLKRQEETEWLKDVNSQSLQHSIDCLDKAFASFFRKKTAYPRFKNKRSRQSFHVPQSVSLVGSVLSIPKFREGLKINIHRKIGRGEVKNATISKTATGKYFSSILVETGELIPKKNKISENQAVGIDIGIKTFAVLSDGSSIANPRNLQKSLKRIKRLSKKLSRKTKGSSNRNKARIALAITHEKVANQRNDFLNKASKMIVDKYDTICLETLRPANMIKNHRLAIHLSDISIGSFNRMLEYKAEWYGKNIIRIGAFEPSSKMCTCGSINKELKLSDRKWECKECGAKHDRDLLAANNIKRFAFHPKNLIGQELSESKPVELAHADCEAGSNQPLVGL